MREAKRKVARRAPGRTRKAVAESPSSEHAADLMALAVEAAQSRHLPDFLQRFAERSMHMLKAAWCGVAVFRGRETEIHLAGGVSNFPRGTKWIAERASEPRQGPEILPSPGRAESLGVADAASNVVLVPIAASDGERLGALCLLTARRSIRAEETILLEALASHAALSL